MNSSHFAASSVKTLFVGVVALNQTAFVALTENQSDLSQKSHNSDDSAHLKVQFERMLKSIGAVGAATYHWNIADDTIEWTGDIDQVFGHVEPPSINTGRSYASLLDPDNFTSRFETVMRNKNNDSGSGVPFSIEYSIKPHGREHELSIWIEDIGRWYAGPDGRPAEVFGIIRQIDDRHERDQHLQFMGNCDPLTGMMNRGRLTEALGETIELAAVEEHSSAFLLVAINNLAVVNDAYGFDVADEVVSTIGRRLREVVRTGDVIGRYSGSKFGIILARAKKEELNIAAERFLTIARQRVIETERGPVWAMLSIGGLTLPYDKADANMTMSLAEEALSEAMRLPSDGFVAYQPSSGRESERKLNSRCAVEIVHSLKENNFRLAYQPVVHAKTKEIVFHEALLRMRCDNGDLVAAGHLVPIAEKLGLIRLIDRSVVFQVLTALRQFPTARIALNISGVTANDPRWFEKLTDILSENVDITDRLTIEITETVALHDVDQTIGFIQKLHSLGCKVAIDDFGAGFTSFRNLKELNVDKVKIDGSFCENLSHNIDNQYFVRTLIDLAQKFELEVVAEWVENEEDAALLTEWGADYLQGRLYGMAETDSPWGEPIHTSKEVCVVPSEILFQDDDEDQTTPSPDVAQNSQNRFGTVDDETAKQACPFDAGAFAETSPEQTAVSDVFVTVEAGANPSDEETIELKSETVSQPFQVQLPETAPLNEFPVASTQESVIEKSEPAPQQEDSMQSARKGEINIEQPVENAELPPAEVPLPVETPAEVQEATDETVAEKPTEDSDQEIDVMELEMQKLRDAIKQLDAISQA
jgi:diguanylate cyclase (GGDEF)-like protein